MFNSFKKYLYLKHSIYLIVNERIFMEIVVLVVDALAAFSGGSRSSVPSEVNTPRETHPLEIPTETEIKITKEMGNISTAKELLNALQNATGKSFDTQLKKMNDILNSNKMPQINSVVGETLQVEYKSNQETLSALIRSLKELLDDKKLNNPNFKDSKDVKDKKERIKNMANAIQGLNKRNSDIVAHCLKFFEPKKMQQAIGESRDALKNFIISGQHGISAQELKKIHENKIKIHTGIERVLSGNEKFYNYIMQTPKNMQHPTHVLNQGAINREFKLINENSSKLGMGHILKQRPIETKQETKAEEKPKIDISRAAAKATNREEEEEWVFVPLTQNTKLTPQKQQEQKEDIPPPPPEVKEEEIPPPPPEDEKDEWDVNEPPARERSRAFTERKSEAHPPHSPILHAHDLHAAHSPHLPKSSTTAATSTSQPKSETKGGTANPDTEDKRGSRGPM